MGPPWGPIGAHGFPMGPYGFPMGPHEFPMGPMGPHGFPMGPIAPPGDRFGHHRMRWFVFNACLDWQGNARLWKYWLYIVGKNVEQMIFSRWIDGFFNGKLRYIQVCSYVSPENTAFFGFFKNCLFPATMYAVYFKKSVFSWWSWVLSNWKRMKALEQI